MDAPAPPGSRQSALRDTSERGRGRFFLMLGGITRLSLQKRHSTLHEIEPSKRGAEQLPCVTHKLRARGARLETSCLCQEPRSVPSGACVTDPGREFNPSLSPPLPRAPVARWCEGLGAEPGVWISQQRWLRGRTERLSPLCLV